MVSGTDKRQWTHLRVSYRKYIGNDGENVVMSSGLNKEVALNVAFMQVIGKCCL